MRKRRNKVKTTAALFLFISCRKGNHQEEFLCSPTSAKVLFFGLFFLSYLPKAEGFVNRMNVGGSLVFCPYLMVTVWIKGQFRVSALLFVWFLLFSFVLWGFFFFSFLVFSLLMVSRWLSTSGETKGQRDSLVPK